MSETPVLGRMSHCVDSLGSTCREEFSPCKSWHTILLLGFLPLIEKLAKCASVRNTARPYVHKYLEPSPLVRISFLTQRLVLRPYHLVQACSPAFPQSHSHSSSYSS